MLQPYMDLQENNPIKDTDRYKNRDTTEKKYQEIDSVPLFPRIQGNLMTSTSVTKTNKTSTWHNSSVNQEVIADTLVIIVYHKVEHRVLSTVFVVVTKADNKNTKRAILPNSNLHSATSAFSRLTAQHVFLCSPVHSPYEVSGE